MNKLMKYFKKYTLMSILAPLFKLFEATMELLIPLFVADIINNGINAGADFSYILKAGGLLLLLGALDYGFAIAAQYFSAKVATSVASDIRSDTYRKINSLSYIEFDELGKATMINRLSGDILQLQTGINMVLRTILRSPFIVFGALVMAIIVDAKVAIVFAITIPVLFIIVSFIMKSTYPKYKDVSKQMDSVINVTRDNLYGNRVIRAFNQEENEIADFDDKNKTLNKKQNAVSRISAMLNPLTYSIVNIAIIFVLYFASKDVDNGIILQGEVIALFNYMSQILVELIKSANLIIFISRAMASANRISDVLNMESSLKKDNLDKTNDEAYLVFDHVSANYNGRVDALNDISFKVNKGETIGIIGGTGAGKTTLINLIPHFYDTSSGDIYLDGKNINAYDTSELTSRIGIVPQKACLFSGTIRENLSFNKKGASDEELLKAIHIAQADNVIKSKEKGLDSIVLTNGKNFSGGQKQRLTIARALVGNPEIIILDDSASALDFITDLKLRKSIAALDYKPTTIIVSQRTSAVKNADKIIVLDHGNLMGIGTHDELLNTCPIYKEIYDSQFEKEGAQNV